MFLNRQIHVPLCAEMYKLEIKAKQSNFERKARKILSFERYLSQIRDIEKNTSYSDFPSFQAFPMKTENTQESRIAVIKQL